ncbi:MAG: hypothetical protein BWY56_01988 [Acidobacteria bacterium ADurb.Bin340]|nr:MAG: hypothetical protein BWY56_01988 [Acidobacteria bacterium ADurb.Bin340]
MDHGRSHEIRHVLPFQPAHVTFRGAHRFAFERNTDGGGSLFAQDPDGGWELVGTVPQSLAVARVFPLSENRFLLQSPLAFKGKGSFSPYALGRLGDDGFIRMDRVLDVGPSNRPWRLPTRGSRRDSVKDGAMESLEGLVLSSLQAATPASFVPLKGGGVLLYPSVGRLVLLDAEGRVRRRVLVHPELDKFPLLKTAEKAPIILGAAPLPSGVLLLAVRSVEHVQKGACRFRFPDRAEDFLSRVEGWQPEAGSVRDASSMQAFWTGKAYLEAFGFSVGIKARSEDLDRIHWMRLDPETGRLSLTEPHPSGAPTHLGPDVDPVNFRFIAEGEAAVRMVP